MHLWILTIFEYQNYQPPKYSNIVNINKCTVYWYSNITILYSIILKISAINMIHRLVLLAWRHWPPSRREVWDLPREGITATLCQTFGSLIIQEMEGSQLWLNYMLWLGSAKKSCCWCLARPGNPRVGSWKDLCKGGSRAHNSFDQWNQKTSFDWLENGSFPRLTSGIWWKRSLDSMLANRAWRLGISAHQGLSPAEGCKAGSATPRVNSWRWLQDVLSIS